MGAWLTCGGFGGSAIALVPTAQKDRVELAVLWASADHGLRTPDIFTALLADGAQRISLGLKPFRPGRVL